MCCRFPQYQPGCILKFDQNMKIRFLKKRRPDNFLNILNLKDDQKVLELYMKQSPLFLLAQGCQGYGLVGCRGSLLGTWTWAVSGIFKDSPGGIDMESWDGKQYGCQEIDMKHLSGTMDGLCFVPDSCTHLVIINQNVELQLSSLLRRTFPHKKNLAATLALLIVSPPVVMIASTWC